jgi:hypothetical protein
LGIIFLKTRNRPKGYRYEKKTKYYSRLQSLVATDYSLSDSWAFAAQVTFISNHGDALRALKCDGMTLRSENNSLLVGGVVSEAVLHEISKVAELLSEIASVCDQHAGGVVQINSALAETDGVTPQNAASAKAGASAPEALDSQALQLATMVDEMLSMVGGTG